MQDLYEIRLGQPQGGVPIGRRAQALRIPMVGKPRVIVPRRQDLKDFTVFAVVGHDDFKVVEILTEYGRYGSFYQSGLPIGRNANRNSGARSVFKDAAHFRLFDNGSRLFAEFVQLALA